MFVVNKKRFSVRHFDEYKKQLLTAQQEALNILGCSMEKKSYYFGVVQVTFSEKGTKITPQTHI